MSRTESPAGRSLYRYRFGTAEFDQARFVLSVDGRPVAMERRPLEVLEMLLQHVGEVVTQQELLDSVWSDRVTIKQVVPNAIAKLRRALGPANEDCIVTQPRVGYRFTGPVERIAVGHQLASQLALAAGQPVPGRPEYRLDSQLKGSAANEIWLAQPVDGGEPRVFKFSVDGDGLSALKREATLSRVLQQTLAEPSAFTRVLDWNFSEPPFFLELSYGGTDLLRWAQSEPGLTSLTREQRIELFVQIAEAVGAAHSVGVLHKDIKPANVLVRNENNQLRVSLTDFGSGKLLQPQVLEAMGITALGMTVTPGNAPTPESGTPLYWAPEVIAGQVSTIQSDVYALGILLFQLLAGDLKRPFTPGWEQEIDDELLAEDIAAATARDPGRRLQSATELAERLRGLDTRRTVRTGERAEQADALRARDALAKSRARRPWLVAAVASLMAGLAGTTILYRQAESARHEIQQQAIRSERINEFWTQNVIRYSDPVARQGDPKAQLGDVLLRAGARIDESFADDPDIAASIHFALAASLVAMVKRQDAADHYARAHEQWAQTRGINSEEALKAQLYWGRILLFMSQVTEASEKIDSAAAAIAALPAPSPDLLATARYAQATLHYVLQDWSVAARLHEETLAMLPGTSFEDTTRYDISTQAGDIYIRTAQWDKAEALLRTLLAPAPELNISTQRVVANRVQLSQVLRHKRAYDEAEALMLDALTTLEESGQADSSYIYYYTANSLSNHYQQTQAWDKAVAYAQKAHAGMARLLGKDNDATLMAHADMAIAQLLSGVSDSSAELQTIRDTLQQRYGSEFSSVQVIDYHLALNSAKRGDYADAQQRLSTLNAEALAAGTMAPNWDLRLQSFRTLCNWNTLPPNDGLRVQLESAGKALQQCRCDPHVQQLIEQSAAGNVAACARPGC